MLSASVTVDQEVVSSIGKGVLVFAAVAPGDTEKELTTIASKVLKMKLWDDEAGGRVRSPFEAKYMTSPQALADRPLVSQWKKSVTDIGGEVLCGMLPVLKARSS